MPTVIKMANKSQDKKMISELNTGDFFQNATNHSYQSYVLVRQYIGFKDGCYEQIRWFKNGERDYHGHTEDHEVVELDATITVHD